MSDTYTVDPQGIVKCSECQSTNVLISGEKEAHIYQCIDCAKKKYDVAGAIIWKGIVNGKEVRGEHLLNHQNYNLLKDFGTLYQTGTMLAITNQVLPPQMFTK